MQPKYKTLTGSLLVLLALGSIYAWSLFNHPLAVSLGVSGNTAAFTFGIMSLCVALGASVSGILKVKLGIRRVVLLSALLSGCGLLLAACVPALWALYLGAGILLGLGDGLGYMLVLTNCVRFFPDKKGLISALSIGAYGGGSFIFKYIHGFTLNTLGLSGALWVWGCVLLLTVAAGAFLIYDSLQHHAADGKTAAGRGREMELREAVRTREYWVLSAMFLIDCMCGLYVIGVASDIGRELVNLTPAAAATAVSVIAAANIAGRLVIGVLSDKVPRIRLISCDQILSLLAFALLFFTSGTLTFYTAMALLSFSFGGTITIYPSLVSDFFGLKNFAKNYGLLYLGFGIGSISGYGIAGVTGGFIATFIAFSFLLLIALFLSFRVKLPQDLSLGHTELVRRHELKV